MRSLGHGVSKGLAGTAFHTLRSVSATAFLAIGLASCGGAPPVTFDLTAPTYSSLGHGGGGSLVVTEPVASSPTDSDRIVVRPSPETVATLKGAQWADRLPRLVQTRLVQTFENARYLRSVGRPDGKIAARYSLNCEIRRFEMDVASGEAIVEISVKIADDLAGKVVAAQIFSAKVPASADNPGVAAVALDTALGHVMRQIVAWAGPRA